MTPALRRIWRSAGGSLSQWGVSGWTGGQYSLLRALLGLYLLVHFIQLFPYGAEIFSNEGVLPNVESSPLALAFPNFLGQWDSPFAVGWLIAVGCIACPFLIVGAWDRSAALVLWYVWACLFGRNPLISNPALPYVGWMLLAHVLMPPAPFGSHQAYGRVDPKGDWRMSRVLYLGAWILLALGYTYSGATKLVSPSWLDGTAFEKVLNNPLARPGFLRDALLALPAPLLKGLTWGALGMELAFAPLALVRKCRPWIWLALVLMHIGLVGILDFTELSLGMLLFHALVFDPAWVKPLGPKAKDRLFYDGNCGLCHRSVRFILAEEPAETFRFAPLQGEKFNKALAKEERLGLPESLVVRKENGEVLVRSDGAAYIAKRLGGYWRILGTLLGWIPRPFRDLGYDLVARVRYRLFRQPKEACPILPAELRKRFDQ